ncbi:MAG: response regulator transcription factor [Saprospiraceae bacterium]
MIKLLLVDDHPILLEGMEAIFEQHPDIRVIGQAQSGLVALETLRNLALQQNLPDIAVLDITMPGLDGIETAKKIREAHPAVKVILFTMEGEGDFILNALEADIQSYIIKTKKTGVLIQAIRKVYTGENYWPPELIDIIAEARRRKPKEETATLSKREKEVLRLMAYEPSLTAKQIAERLSIVPSTVETHIRNLKSKLGMHKQSELVLYGNTHDLSEEQDENNTEK